MTIVNGYNIAAEAYLSRANLSGADLSRANLSRANLSGADLSDVDLSGADLSGANLSGANLSDVDLSGADLSGAYLRGADLRCFGDMDYIKTLQIERWPIGYTHDTIQIGCQRHGIDKWSRWNTEAGHKWISSMDGHALEWAQKHLDLVLKIVETSPAKPTMEKTT